MAAIGLSWWIGLALAPTLGTQLFAVLEPRLPQGSRLTPRPA